MPKTAPDWSANRRVREPLPHQLSHRRRKRDAVDRVRHSRVGPRPRSQPSIVSTTGQHQNRRAVVDLIFQLTADTHATARHRLAVKHEDVDATGIERLDVGLVGGALDVSDRGRSVTGCVPIASLMRSRVVTSSLYTSTVMTAGGDSTLLIRATPHAG